MTLIDEAGRANASSETPTPEIPPPLAPFAGAQPPAPDWFKAALAREPERGWVEARGTQLELLTWGEIGKPGLLFVHGARAQADWWSFIVPFFADHYRIAALSLPGMGRSGWRDRYDLKDFPADAEVVAKAAGLHADGRAPVYIGHSFGGSNVHLTAHRRPELMSGAILVDCALKGASKDAAAEQRRIAGVKERPASAGGTGRRHYATLAEALGRFRLLPIQPVENLFIADYIARNLLERVPAEGGQPAGWAWSYDPDFWAKFDYDTPRPGTYADDITVPIAHIHGELSAFRLDPERVRAMPPHAIEFDVPGAHHHVMLDQPLALVAAIRAVLAAWGR